MYCCDFSEVFCTVEAMVFEEDGGQSATEFMLLFF